VQYGRPATHQWFSHIGLPHSAHFATTFPNRRHKHRRVMVAIIVAIICSICSVSFSSFFPTTQTTLKAGPFPTLTRRVGSLGRREHLGRRSGKPRGSISPHAGEGRGFYPSTGAPRSLLPALGGGDPHRPISLPGRSRDGSIPFGMRRGPPRAHSPPGPSRLDPEGFRPVAALGETVQIIF
jgi:hypothetical protein